MAIVFQTDKRSGITYAYESISRWDKEKKQSRAKRTLIGRVDPDTGEIVPTDGRNRKKKEELSSDKKPGPVATSVSKRSFFGATYLLDAIAQKTGVLDDLKACFPDSYEQLLSIAYYLVTEDSAPLYRFEKWGQTHHHPFNDTITSQRSSDLFASITEENKMAFFKRQGKRRKEKEFWAYDTTSISSYSEQLNQIQYGQNKENDRLPQLNLALIFGEESNLPFYYRKLAGNIPDSKTVNHLLADFDVLGFDKTKLVMDRGFYSEANINGLFKTHTKFLIGTKLSLKFVKQELEAIYDDFRSFESFSDKYELYHQSRSIQWSYRQERPYKGDTIESKKRAYLHFYYNIDKAAEEEKRFDRKLMVLRQELELGNRRADHEKLYHKYFTIKSTPKRGTQVTVKEEVVKQAKRYYGFFVLMTNETMDAITALEIYRNKDLVEKAFGNLKERLSMRRMLVSSEQSLDGKIFVEFLALIFLSYIKKQMQDADLFKKYSLASLLDKLDVIECFHQPGKELRVGEVLEKQKEIYLAMDVLPPTSL